jgi:uncharacterized protein YndB with AHSA1/START domain
MTEQELEITRVISYPREVVFAAWTHPDLLVKWFAPRGCTILVTRLEIKEGGKFHWCIKNPMRPDCWCTGEFLKIDVPTFIQYKIRLADENGNPVSSADAFKDSNWPEETMVNVTFKGSGEKTELTINQSIVQTLAKKTGAYQGWIEMLDVLEERLSFINSTSNA